MTENGKLVSSSHEMARRSHRGAANEQRAIGYGFLGLGALALIIAPLQLFASSRQEDMHVSLEQDIAAGRARESVAEVRNDADRLVIRTERRARIARVIGLSMVVIGATAIVYFGPQIHGWLDRT